MEKKKHHYVPVTYLNGFTDDRGFLCVARKGATPTASRAKPSETAFRKFYYSQPLPEGGHDNNRLEDMFSTFETEWGTISRVLANRERANHLLTQLLGFIGFQRIRVPAFRDAIEQAMANYAKGAFDELERRGELPPPPPEYPDILKMTVITIDPHQSIHAMVQMLKQLGPFFESLGYSVVENHSEVDFITSDNPVAYYATDVPPGQLTPYEVSPRRPAELIFPVSVNTLILGSTHDRERFHERGLKYVRWRDPERVRGINRMTARFGYEAIFSRQRLPPAFMEKYGAKSPVLERGYPGFDPDHVIMPPFVFGDRTRLPKWDRNKDYRPPEN